MSYLIVVIDDLKWLVSERLMPQGAMFGLLKFLITTHKDSLLVDTLEAAAIGCSGNHG